MKTKIITTIGPSSWDYPTMKALLKAGADVFRFNMKHDTIDSHKQHILDAKHLARQMGHDLEILAVLQGPEIRVFTPGGESLSVRADRPVTFADDFVEGVPCLKVPEADVIFNSLEVGDEILLDDGFQSFTVLKKINSKLITRAAKDYNILDKRGMNLPGKEIDLPALTKQDLERLDAMALVDVDYVSYSFVRNKEDITALRIELNQRDMKSKIVAKIENQAAIDNIDEIIEASDVVMIARGDLGIEVPIERLAYYQKEIVKKCNLANKPVIVATQMLMSMTKSLRPTRAEAVDVANAVLDGANFIMLSNETATGDYPVEAVATMRQIASFYEQPGLTLS